MPPSFYNRFFSLLFLLIFIRSFAQIDSITTEEVVVEGYPEKILLKQSTASVGVIDPQALALQPSHTLIPAMNQIAGIRMEERSPGSYRLAIRGSLLRSPFGIRNVKLYLDEFPLTDAGGNSYLQLIDKGAVQRIELLKGPHGSLYGANTGGVALLSLVPARLDSSGQMKISGTGGSYGLLHESVDLSKHVQGHGFRLYQAYQRADGYREHSAFQRHYVQCSDVFRYYKGFTLKGFVFYSALDYQTPGALTRKQYEQAPAQARPRTTNTLGATEQHAAVYNRTLYGGLAHEAILHPKLKHVVALFSTRTDFQNPFITNYEVRKEATFGFRTYFELSDGKGRPHGWRWHLGMEWQRTPSEIGNFGNKGGHKDTVQAKDKLLSGQHFFFTQATLRWHRWLLEGGLSLNYFMFNAKSLLNPAIAGIHRRFEPQWMPRAAVSFRISPYLFGRASLSKGYSPPTMAEVRPSDNLFYTQLQPESGYNYETGLRWHSTQVQLDAVVFYYRLQNAIVRRVSQTGIEYFINAGSTKQVGFEWQGKAILKDRTTAKRLQSLFWTSSLTQYMFEFESYKNGHVDLAEKQLTGVPKLAVTSGIEVRFFQNWTFYGQYNYTSRIPLNDLNTDYASDYHLLAGKLSWRQSIGNKWLFEVFGGVDNTLNQKYSLGNDLNALGGRYYNAAAPRNFYAGASASY